MVEQGKSKYSGVYWIVDDKYPLPTRELAIELDALRLNEFEVRCFYKQHGLEDWYEEEA